MAREKNPAPTPAEKGAGSEEAKAAALAAAQGAGEQNGPTDQKNETAGDVSLEKTGDGEATVQVVIIGSGWSLPLIKEFPATLLLENASPSRRTLHKIGLYMQPNETKRFVFTEESYAIFSRYLSQIALANDWEVAQDVSIESEGEQNGGD